MRGTVTYAMRASVLALAAVLVLAHPRVAEGGAVVLASDQGYFGHESEALAPRETYETLDGATLERIVRGFLGAEGAPSGEASPAWVDAETLARAPPSVVVLGAGRALSPADLAGAEVAAGVRRDQLVDVEALEELRQASTKPKVFRKDEFLALPSARCGDLDRPALLQLIAEAGGVVRSAAPDEFDPDAPLIVLGAAGDGRLLMVTAYASTGYAVLDAAWCAECVAAGARLAPAPRHYLATPPPQKLEELRQTFEPVWGLPRFRAPSVDEIRTCAAHARAHRGGHWFYDDAVVDEAPDTDAALAAHGVTPLSRVPAPGARRRRAGDRLPRVAAPALRRDRRGYR